MNKRHLVWLSALLVCACDPGSVSTASFQTSPTPEQIQDELQRVFDEAVAHCEVQLLEPAPVTTPSGAVATTVMPSPCSTDTLLMNAIAENPVVTVSTAGGGIMQRRLWLDVDLSDPVLAPPDWGVSPPLPADQYARNGCAGAVAIDGSDSTARPTPGFCRADFNYCLAHFMSLRARSLGHPVSSREARDRVLAESRSRFELSALEHSATLAIVAPTCVTATPHAECARPGYRTAVASRVADAIANAADLVDAQSVSAMAATDALVPSLLGSDYGRAAFGPDSARTRMVASLLGDLPVLESPPAAPAPYLSSGLLPLFGFTGSLAANVLQGSQMFGIVEREGHVLTTPLATSEGTTIPAGTRVDVVLLHFDPSSTFGGSAWGSMDFSRPVLGTLRTTAMLNATDASLGRPGVAYPTTVSPRGLETGADFVTISRTSVQLSAMVNSSGVMDEMRILVAAGPPDRPRHALSAPREGPLGYGTSAESDARARSALALIEHFGVELPVTTCVDVATQQTVEETWGDAGTTAQVVYERLDAAVQAGFGPRLPDGSLAPAPSVLVARTGIGAPHVRMAVDYLRDLRATMHTNLVLEQVSPSTAMGRRCATSARVEQVAGPVAQRDRRGLASLLVNGTGAPYLGSALGTPTACGGGSSASWYAWSTGQTTRVGTAGTLQLLRHRLSRLRTTPGAYEGASVAMIDDALALTDGLLGDSWTEWSVCGPEQVSAGLCSGASTWRGTWSRYSRTAFAGDVLLVRDETRALCMLARQSSAACPIGAGGSEVVITPVSSGTFGGTGGYVYQQFDLGDVQFATSTQRWYLLARTGSGAATRYARLDIVEPARVGTVAPFGGAIATHVDQLLARDPLDPAQPLFTSVGLPHSFLPPLENELLDDGDGFEDSFHAYLSHAEAAQAHATAALDVARTAELELAARDRRVRGELELAALAQEEVVAEECGAGGPTSCRLLRVPSISLCALGVVESDPGPDPAPDGPCEPLLEEFTARFASEVGEPPTADGVGQYLRNGLTCARWMAHRTACDVQLRELPQVLVTRVQEGRQSDYSEYGGHVREELIRAHDALIGLTRVMGSLDTGFDEAMAHVAAAEAALEAATPESGWWAKLRCYVNGATQVAQGLLGVAAAITTAGSSEAIIIGGQQVGSLQSGPPSTAERGVSGLGSVGNVLNGIEAIRQCGDENGEERTRLAQSALSQVVGSMDRISQTGAEAARFVATAALLDNRLDTAATRADIADRRRRITEALATSDLGGDPGWRALQGLQAERARRSLTRAQQAAFIARRAIELRLATDMDSMMTEEPFVPAPSSWSRNVFVLDTAVEVRAGETPTSPVVVYAAGEAIEEYVRWLGDFVRGYQVSRRFDEGRDETVLDLSSVAPPLTFPGASATERPLSQRLLYLCQDGAELTGGATVLPTSEPPLGEEAPEPCAAHGGVRAVRFALQIPAQPSEAYGSRFAAGNYNYRIRTIALNVVGRGVMDCTRARRPAECWGDGSLRYRITQLGEVELEDYDRVHRTFWMTPGVIQGARALADERWLTTPLSATDRGLVEHFRRTEWWGRPLGGTYHVEIVSRPEVDWRHVEDVQLLIEYEYWTRQGDIGG